MEGAQFIRQNIPNLMKCTKPVDWSRIVKENMGPPTHALTDSDPRFTFDLTHSKLTPYIITVKCMMMGGGEEVDQTTYSHLLSNQVKCVFKFFKI